ncbi:MAG: RNA-binding S4 domain-containing protein [Ruminococcus sp.]|nr:RNA-binding S4 domain-containing protein [Ruminococcus sp.]
MDKEQIKITTEYIKLDSFMKFSNMVMSGGDAKGVISEGRIKVNGEVCTMRGKKLRVGDKVQIDEADVEFEIV